MQIDVRCLGCGEMYACNQATTKIFGPIIDTKCPACGHFVSKNYSAFLFDQADSIEGKVGRARHMIAMAQAISEIVSNEESFKKKK